MKKIITLLAMATIMLLSMAPAVAQHDQKSVVPKKLESSRTKKFGPIIAETQTKTNVVVVHRFSQNIDIIELMTLTDGVVEAVGIKPTKFALSIDSAVNLVVSLFGDPGELENGTENSYELADPVNQKNMIPYKQIVMSYRPYNAVFTLNAKTRAVEFVTITFNWV